MSKLVSLGSLRSVDYVPTVKVCIPYYQGIPSRMVQLIQHLSAHEIPGYNTALIMKQTTLIHFARNEMVDEPPDQDWDFLFFLDSDMGFESATFNQPVEVWERGKKFIVPYMISLMKRLLDLRLNIVGGLYCQRSAPHLPLVFKKAKKGDPYSANMNWVNLPDGGVHEVDAVATGFLCIHKSVFKAFAERQKERREALRLFQNWKTPEGIAQLPREIQDYLSICKPDIAPPFWCDYWHEELTGVDHKVGEDVYFCAEAQKLGFKIYCDIGVAVGHESQVYVTPDHYRNTYMDDMVARHQKWTEKTGADKLPGLDDYKPRFEIIPEPESQEVVANG